MGEENEIPPNTNGIKNFFEEKIWLANITEIRFSEHSNQKEGL
jgi:hypothetical protein